jgi:acetyl/propionyl-CoA carboxylase alpha subunit
VLEESPSVLLLPETRLAIQRQAAMLAKAVKYR